MLCDRVIFTMGCEVMHKCLEDILENINLEGVHIGQFSKIIS
jgi:hypothetical protein